MNAVINHLVEKEGISADRFIFKYGEMNGDCNTVDLRDGTGEEGPDYSSCSSPQLTLAEDNHFCFDYTKKPFDRAAGFIRRLIKGFYILINFLFLRIITNPLIFVPKSLTLPTFMRLTVIFVFLAITAVSCSKFAKVQKSNDYEYKLRMAEKYYVAKKYHFASQLYAELFPLLKGQPQSEDLFYKYALLQLLPQRLAKCGITLQTICRSIPQQSQS